MTPSLKPYSDRSAFSRWFSFWRQKQLINGYPEGQGVLSSSGFLPGTREAREALKGMDSILMHASITFLSKAHADKRWWYRATVKTQEGAALSMIEEKIEEQFNALLEEKGLSWEAIFSSKPGDKAFHSELSDIEGVVGDDGSTSVWGYHLAELRKVGPEDWEALPIQIGATVDRTLPGWIGVDAVLAGENLTRDALVSFVRRFWSAKERGSQEPVDWTGRGNLMKTMMEGAVNSYAQMDAEAREDGFLV